MSRIRAIAMLVGILGATLVTPGCNDVTPPPPELTVTAVDPGTGPLAGGTSVTITGTNFLNVTSVTIGGNALGSRTVLSAAEITGTTPTATSAGAKDVVVTSSRHGSGMCRGCFTYGSGSGAGGQIAFMSLRDSNWEIYVMNATARACGTSLAARLTTRYRPCRPTARRSPSRPTATGTGRSTW